MDDFLFWLWVSAAWVIVAATSYTVVFFHVFFQDYRIALLVLSGKLLAAMASFHSWTLCAVLAALSGLGAIGFFCYHLAKNIRQRRFWLPLVLFVISSTGAVMSFIKLSSINQ
ncbi:hypothetical protein QSV34_03965 [Porticoccus sp. W117]|uniref:hypothetical protein n=1 Tax=Porticoccus sp. W117 TaxID=3054777 RepID=UPI0025945A27|nr:hypothetical protein [Porticoccus sp. W117]MDM3870509.1 hypothetical protein [Porticoccus sp. W117]